MPPFGTWWPDVAGPNSGYAAVADGVLPQASPSGIGYGPLASLVTATGAEALSGAPRGVVTAFKNDGSYVVIAATASTIELMDSAYQWTDIETGRTVTSGDDVSFAQFGKYVINTDTTSGMKAYDVDGGGANAAVTAGPAARCVFTCNNVVFGGGTTASPRRLASSAIGDHTNWTTGGADGKTFEDGGAIVGGRDLKNGAAVLFQETAMRLIQFGGTATYRIDKIADGRGAVSDRGIVAFDGMVFYLATDGFYKYTLAGGNEPIGAEKFNRWLAAQITSADYENVIGAVDPYQKVVWFRISSTLLLGYDWQLNVPFTAQFATSTLSRLALSAVTIDSLSGTIDALDVTLDSRLLEGGGLLFGALDSTYKFATFSGSPKEATLQTCDIVTPRVMVYNRCTPDTDSPNATISIGVSDNRQTAKSWKDPESTRDSGTTPVRGTGKVAAFKQVIPAGDDWTFANGVEDIEAVPKGNQ